MITTTELAFDSYWGAPYMTCEDPDCGLVFLAWRRATDRCEDCGEPVRHSTTDEVSDEAERERFGD